MYNVLTNQRIRSIDAFRGIYSVLIMFLAMGLKAKDQIAIMTRCKTSTDCLCVQIK